MSLVELIAQADERGLATSGLGCLDRCVPLLGVGGPGDPEEDVLRPLWASLAEDGADWGARLVTARDELSGAAGKGEAAELVRRMLGAAPERAVAVAWREWADACSVAALQVHRMLDVTEDRAAGVSARREGRTEGCRRWSRPNCAARPRSWNCSRAAARAACGRPWSSRRRVAGCCGRPSRGARGDAADALRPVFGLPSAPLSRT